MLPSFPPATATASATPPLRPIPGSYGPPVIGPLRDRLDYFWFQGPEEFFRRRAATHRSTVFRANIPPTFPLFVGTDPRVVAVVDAAAFTALFDPALVDKRDILIGPYNPGVGFTGGTRVGVYLDTEEPEHERTKAFSMDLLHRGAYTHHHAATESEQEGEESSGRGIRSRGNDTNGPIFKCALSPSPSARALPSPARLFVFTGSPSPLLGALATGRTAMAAARACLVALVLAAAALFVEGGAAAAAAAGNAGRASAQQRRRQLLRQRKVHSHLRRLNKAPVASIESPDGDTIDCVPISNQPAFDHPFLKNHTIQMRPAYHPEGLYDESKVASQQNTQRITQMWHQNGKCPENTIPIRRTKKEDVMRASSVRRYGKKKHRSTPNPMSVDPDMLNESGHQHAIAYVEGDKYYGAKATINVWQPKIEQANEFSLSQLWILGGSFGQDLNSIEAGWQVSPDLYGDNNTRLFTYWTSDAYQATGCYNLLCSGFIQINNQIAMGASIFPISNYGGSQYDINILVWKDPKEGNWWLQFGNDYVLGYWPSFLFSYLADSASMIEWGGEVVNTQTDGSHTSTQMGSGHFPEEGFGKSSYFRNIQVVDSTNNMKAPQGVGSFTEQSNCYDVQNGNNGDWGTYFYYGGPGKNPNCP